MPELPEVETTCRGLLGAIKGERIVNVHIRRHDLRWPIPQTLAKALTGATITDIRRRAKYLLFDLSTGDHLLAHLGMSGSFIVTNAQGYEPKTHDHVLITLQNGLLIVFNDPRRFGMMDIVRKGEEGTHDLLKNLGPEPLSKEFSRKYLGGQLERRPGPIKPVLMDQKLVVGVGNIYASESLFLCGVNPFLPAKSVVSKAPELIKAIQKTLNAAIASGGSTLRNYVGASNEAGYFQHHFNVYDRDGEPCFVCGTEIESANQAGRATYWCPTCQPSTKKRQKR